MKNFLLVLCIFFTSLAYGQFSDAQNQYLDKNNLVDNPGFENGKRSWSGGSAITVTSANGAPEGTNAGCQTLSAEPLEMNITTTNKAGVIRGQGISLLDIYATFEGVQLCSVVDGSVDEGSCSDITRAATTNWSTQLVSEFVFGSTSHGLRARTAGNVTGTFCADKAFVGRMPATMTPEVSQTQVTLGYFPATASASLSRTSTSLGAFTTAAAFPAPVFTVNDLSCTSTDANKFAITCTGIGAGRVVVRAYLVMFSSASTNSSVAIFDGTTQAPAQAIHGGSGTGNLYPSTAYGEFNYTTPGSRTFELYVASGSGSVTLSADDVAGQGNPKFEIIYYPPASKIYSQQCADAAACDNDLSAHISSGGGINSQNLNAITSCSGGGGTVTCNFKAGYYTTTPSCQATAFPGGSFRYANILSLSTTQVQVSTYRSDSSTLIAAAFFLSCQKQGADFKAQNVITGTFAEMMKVPGVSKPKTCHYVFGGTGSLASQTNCTAGTCVEYYDNCQTGTPPTFNSTGIYDNLTFSSGTFANSSFVVCHCVPGTASNVCTPSNNFVSNSSGGLVISAVRTMISSGGSDGTLTNGIPGVTCFGSAP